MPIRGKIINVFSHSRNEVFANQEVQAITQIILGGEYRKGFDISEVKVSKVIFMCDADVDGAHISALLLRLFVMYFPQMIEAGMVYKAIPPLYSIKNGKKNRYFTEQIDMTRYNQRLFLNNYDMKSAKKKKIDNKEITKFLMQNEDYVYHMESLANKYSVDPCLAEMTIFNYIHGKNKVDFTKLKKDVKKAYRFMDVIKVGKTPTIIGTIDESNFIPAGDKFFKDCSIMIPLISANKEWYYSINGKIQSIYQVMKLYKDFCDKSKVQRFKGLGEMSKTQLAESTMHPDMDRTLIRYTINDVKETTKVIREFESNTKKILGEVGRVTRMDLLD